MKPWPLTLCVFAFPAFVMHADDLENRLRDARWEKRVLLVFSSDTRFEEQLDKHRAEIAERDLIVLRATIAKNADLAKSYQVSGDNFKLILIGKDGGEKATQTTPDLPTLFRLIDSMPMRQKEMK